MKSIVHLLLVLISTQVLCQVPDWTKATCDAPATYYNMHQELANGHAVVLDFGSMWCSPCVMDAPLLENVYQHFGAGNAGVKVFGFVLEDQDHNPADCADIENWVQGVHWNFPAFNDALAIYTAYQNAFNNGNGGIPYILVFIPNTSSPENSQLIYNNATGLGNGPGDIAQDIIAVLNQNGYFAVGLESEAASAPFNLYPNPTVDNINLQTKDPLTSISIYATTGKLIKRFKPLSATIDVSYLPVGTYLLKATANQQTFQRLFVKKAL